MVLLKTSVFQGADPNIRTLDEMTPLIQAIKSSNTVLAHLLIDRGADPFATWYDGWTALHEAANSHNLVLISNIFCNLGNHD